MAISTARLFRTGSVPGSPRQTGQTFVLGGSPKHGEQPQKILDLVSSWTCTSSPITGSYLASTSSARAAPSDAAFAITRRRLSHQHGNSTGTSAAVNGVRRQPLGT